MPVVPWSKGPGPPGIRPKSVVTCQLRLEKLPTAIQAISWKAQVRLCKRYRQLMAKGKNAHQVVVAIARELRAFMWAIAKQVAGPPKA